MPRRFAVNTINHSDSELLPLEKRVAHPNLTKQVPAEFDARNYQRKVRSKQRNMSRRNNLLYSKAAPPPTFDTAAGKCDNGVSAQEAPGFGPSTIIQNMEQLEDMMAKLASRLGRQDTIDTVCGTSVICDTAM